MKKENYYELWLRAHEFINEKLIKKDLNFGLMDIANSLYVSKATLERAFQKYGESPWSKFMWCRLALICQRLQESSDTISNIAAEFGLEYEDVKRINRWFGELNCTPSEYRERIKNALNNLCEVDNMNKAPVLNGFSYNIESLSEIIMQSKERWNELVVYAKNQGSDDLAIIEAISYLHGFADKADGIFMEVKDFTLDANSQKLPSHIKMAKLLSDLGYYIDQIILQKDLILFGFEKKAQDIIFEKPLEQHKNLCILCSCIDENNKMFKKILSLVLRRFLLETDLRGTDIIGEFATNLSTRFNTNVEQTIYMISIDDPAANEYASLMDAFSNNK